VEAFAYIQQIDHLLVDQVVEVLSLLLGVFQVLGLVLFGENLLVQLFLIVTVEA